MLNEITIQIPLGYRVDLRIGPNGSIIITLEPP